MNRAKKNWNLKNVFFSNFVCVNLFCFCFWYVTHIQHLNFNFSQWIYTRIRNHQIVHKQFLCVEMICWLIFNSRFETFSSWRNSFFRFSDIEFVHSCWWTRHILNSIEANEFRKHASIFETIRYFSKFDNRRSW